MNDTKAKFEAALAQRKKQKAEEAVRGGFSGGAGFPDIPYAPLHTDQQQAFRFVGLPHLVREKPSDSKRVHIAMILRDDDKKFRCIGPDPKEQAGWLLYRVMNKVLTRHWDKNIPGFGGQLGGYVYDYAAVHPELYNRVSKNNNVENPLERGWRFGPSVLFNVIDRANYAWHKENKKFRVLSKKASESQDRVYCEPGVPDTVFQMVMDDIVATDGNTDWEDYDIVIRKMADKPWYKVYHGIDDFKKLDEDVRALVVKTGVSDEERAWELNDFDNLFPVTPYVRIKSKLGLFFQKVDKVFRTSYYDELAALAEKEESESAGNQARAFASGAGVPPEESGGGTPRPASPPPAAPEPARPAAASPAPASPPVRSAAAPAKASPPVTEAVWAGLADGSYNGKTYVGVPLMTAEEKAMVKRVREDGAFEWLPEAGELYEGSASHFLTPVSVHVDPLDGTVFDQSIPF